MSDRPRARAVTVAALIDVALVVLFAAVGRRSHAEAAGLAGLVRTAWPFVAGLALGWLLARAWLAPFAIRRALVVWPVCVAAGMLLRVVTGQGVQPAFVVVAAIVLGVFLLGWRAALALAARIRRRPLGTATSIDAGGPGVRRG